MHTGSKIHRFDVSIQAGVCCCDAGVESSAVELVAACACSLGSRAAG
jgi:hypothetical protein